MKLLAHVAIRIIAILTIIAAECAVLAWLVLHVTAIPGTGFLNLFRFLLWLVFMFGTLAAAAVACANLGWSIRERIDRER